MNGKTRWVVFAAGSAAAVCLLVCAAAVLAARYSQDLYVWLKSRDSLQVGSPAPDFELASLDGEQTALSQFRGRPVVLTFAVSWCPDCQVEAPLLQSLHESHPELVVLLVDSNEDPGTVRDFARKYGMTHPVLLDMDGGISRQYRIFAIPTTFFIAADGIVRGVVIEAATSKVLAEKLPLIGLEP